MKDEKEWRDLCMTCNYDLICTSRENFERPVWFCEEFDDYVNPVSAQEISEPSELPSRSITEEKDSVKHLGLCVNCDHRETCAFPKPEGGVWHCEEYL